MCGQCGGLQLSGLRAWMEPSSRFGLCRYGASRLLTTGEEGLSQTVLLLSWMMLMWHFFQRLNLFVGRFRSSICVTKLKEALFWQVSVVTTFCQWHAEPQVIVDVSMLPFRQCVVVALVASLSVWCGFSWTCGQRAGVARHCSLGVRTSRHVKTGSPNKFMKTWERDRNF